MFRLDDGAEISPGSFELELRNVLQLQYHAVKTQQTHTTANKSRITFNNQLRLQYLPVITCNTNTGCFHSNHLIQSRCNSSFYIKRGHKIAQIDLTMLFIAFWINPTAKKSDTSEQCVQAKAALY